MLIDTLKKANMQALKEKDSNTRAILSIVINRYNNLVIDSKGSDKEIGEAELIQIIQKVGRELLEEKEGYTKVGNTSMVKNIELQEKVLASYLPKMLSREQIIKEISKLTDKSLPNVMKHFKTNFNGQVDMELVNEVVKSLGP